jgi:rhomboid family GlyGly-CTERM serine protease
MIPVTVAVLAIAFQATGLDIELRYDRHAIQQGSLWLLISGNYVHLGWGHVILNLAGLFMVWWFFIGDFKQYEWLVIFLVSGLFVTCGLYLFNPHLIWYVGLSGLLHGLFLAGGLRLLATEFKFAAVLIIAIVGKLMYEQMMGSLPGTSEMSGGPVVVNSHLFGAIGGVVSFILLWIVGKLGGTKNAGEMSE